MEEGRPEGQQRNTHLGKGQEPTAVEFLSQICGGPLRCFFKEGHDKLCLLEDSLCSRQENGKEADPETGRSGQRLL